MNPGTSRRPVSREIAGLVLVIASAFCYSLLSIFGKIALGLGLPLLPLLATRFVLGAAILWCWVFAVPRFRRDLRGLAPRRAAGLVAWGMIGFTGQSILFFLALRRIPASLTEVLLYTCPAFLALMLWGLTRRRPAASRLLAIGLALAGTWLCAGPAPGSLDSRGVLLATFSGFWYAAFLLWMDRLTPGVPGVIASAWIISGAAVAFAGTSAAAGGGLLVPRGPAQWGSVLGIVLSATVFGFVLFVAGLKRVGPQTASVLSTFEPVGTIGLAALILGERLERAQWLGAACIIGAAFVLAATSRGTPASRVADPDLAALPNAAADA